MITPNPQSAYVTRLAADIRALASIERPSASPGEEEAAQWVKSRFEETGLTVEIETFRYNPDYWTAWGAHGAALWLWTGDVFVRISAYPEERMLETVEALVSVNGQGPTTADQPFPPLDSDCSDFALET